MEGEVRTREVPSEEKSKISKTAGDSVSIKYP